jgi:hypothetical protein
VFAQLTVRGKWEGPHVFVVRLRDDSGKPMPGVRIQDNGPKVGHPPASLTSLYSRVGLYEFICLQRSSMYSASLLVPKKDDTITAACIGRSWKSQ